MRVGGAATPATVQGGPEILSPAGNLSTNSTHLHITITDGSRSVIGGHLYVGSVVRNTAELVLSHIPDW